MNETLKLKSWIRKAFEDREVLMKTALVLHEVSNGSHATSGDNWILKNVTLKWSKSNKGFQYAIDTRYFDGELDGILRKVGAEDLSEYAMLFAKKYWSSDAYDALVVMSDYHYGMRTKEEYQKAKAEYLSL